MPHKRITERTLLVAAATAIGAVGLGLIAMPVPALATPIPPQFTACDQFGFDGHFGFQQSNSWSVNFTSYGPQASGSASAVIGLFGTGPNPSLDGTVAGGIQGRNVDFTITWNNGSMGRYTGVVDDDWFVVGGTVDEANPSSKATFRSTTPLACTKFPVPPQPERAPNTLVETPPIAGSRPAPSQDPGPGTLVATVASDVDVYNVKNEPGGAGQIIGTLRTGQQVNLMGSCKKDDWCNVAGPVVPTGAGWVWGALDF